MMAVDDERVRMAIPNCNRFGALQMRMAGIELVMDVRDDALVPARWP